MDLPPNLFDIPSSSKVNHTSSRPSMAEKLPPGTLCVVCDDLATGNHYSVPSCNGCKTFFRRAVVNNRNFACMGNGDCPVNKGVRCACRHCRYQKCIKVGMDKGSIQNDRDRIGYTKRTRKEKQEKRSDSEDEESRLASGISDSFDTSNHDLGEAIPQGLHGLESNDKAMDPYLARLTTLENNFTLLLSRGRITPYDSLDEGLLAGSKFHEQITVKMSDPIASPSCLDEHKMPFWRSRIIALYIDWAKTFPTFRNLPHSDKVALITNHASSYMIMCEAFRTPEHHTDKIVHPDGHYFTRYPPKDSLFVSTLAGLTPVMAAMIDYVMKPFRRLKISTTEFATLQAIMFFDPDTDGLDSASQRNVAAEQKKLMAALSKHINRLYGSSGNERFANILLRIPTIRKVAAKKNESLQIIDMFNLFRLNALVRETTLGIKPDNKRVAHHAISPLTDVQSLFPSQIPEEPSSR